MDIYHIWCDLKTGVKDTTFSDAAGYYLDHIIESGHLQAWRLTHRKLRLGIPGQGEFHLMLEFNNLQQLDEAFSKVASRSDLVESFHHAMNSTVASVQLALYRDIPDEGRERGSEKF